MLIDKKYDISNFVTVNASGLSFATFTDIRAALIERYKSVYGSDIDLSTANADGVFVNDLALIMNNILQTFKSLYSNLNVDTANGVFLDNLCRLSNVTRQKATKSNVALDVTNLSNSVQTFESLIFVDDAGIEWTSVESVTLQPDETQSILAECNETGPISAPIGWINKTLEVLNLKIEQTSSANVGQSVETDTELRARRAQSNGSAGATVLESVVGALLNISGIKDVKIYNNNSVSAVSAVDETEIAAHSVYVLVRYLEGVNIQNKLIGDIIYLKMTPGITTVESAVVDSRESYEYIPSYSQTQFTSFEQTVHWKKCLPVAPQISITLNAFDFFTEDEKDTIGPKIISYLNNKRIGETLSKSEILIETTYADPLFKGRPTYTVSDNIVFTDTNKDTYYNYTSYSLTGPTITNNLKTYVLKLS